MTSGDSSLASANLAFREGRLEQAVTLYSSARREVPQLNKHIDFNLRFLSRELQGKEKNPFVVGSIESPPHKKLLPNRDVIVVVLATSLKGAGQTARLLSRRANYRIGVVVLVTSLVRSSLKQGLDRLLGQLSSKYALITSECALPGRGWLEHAYEGAKRHAADAVYANTGETSAPTAWSNALAPPTVLQRMLRGEQLSKLRTATENNFLLATVPSVVQNERRDAHSGQIHVIDAGTIEENDNVKLDREVCVIMPSLRPEKGEQKAALLLERAGMDTDVVVAVDSRRQGFIHTLNRAARHTTARYVVYLAEDALPGQNWLRSAHERITSAKKTLLAFNCGKWHGRVAAFGMVDKHWAHSLYGDQILFEGYHAHRADNELTAIARAQGTFVYAPESVLAEHDIEKDFRGSEREASNFRRSDARLFRERFHSGFGGLADLNALAQFHDEYLDLPKFYGNKNQFTITTEPLNQTTASAT